MPTKICKTCQTLKPISEFYKQAARGGYGVRGSCKVCDNQKKKEYRQTLGDNLLERKRQEYERNKEVRLANKKQYRQNNKGKINALVAARKKVIKQRTPKWLTETDKQMIVDIYNLAALKTKIFGFSWHVDHVIPLQGKTVSGLHVPNNLQVIDGIENIKKKNKVLENVWA
jgi:hypothetical protein